MALDLKKTESPNTSDSREETVDNGHIVNEKGTVARIATNAESIDPILERKITRKFDLHLLPWLFGIWLFAFIDRSNIGNAKIDGLTTDLSLTGTKFNTALAVFYIPYILIDVPSNWVLKHVGAGWYLPGLITLWGVVGSLMGITKSYAGLIVCRLLLGLFEGGLFGGMILYLSMFYRRHQILLRIGLWYCAAPLSGAIGGLLAAGLSKIQRGGYNKWPWIFIVEGVITVVFGMISFFFLPHTPATAKFLTQEERDGAIMRLHLDSHGASRDVSVDYEKFNWRWVKMAVFNTNTMLMSFNFLFILVPIYSYSLFLPTIISGLGYKNITAQLFTVPPNAVAFFVVILSAYGSDHYKMRGPFILGGCALGIIGYAIMLGAQSSSVKYGGTFFVAAGVFQMSPAVCAWLNNNVAPHYTRATATGLQVGIGNCAAFLATFTYLEKDKPNYTTGHAINLGMLGLTAITTIVTMWYCNNENKKRARGDRDNRLGAGEELLGYRHPNFRYTL